ncbi:MAG: TAXI family TRAP transporter solute-binding subunit [Bacteroidota bacterium]
MSDSVMVTPGVSSLANLDSVNNNDADMAIIDNFIPYMSDISAIYPIYPQILHVLYKGDSEPESFEDLVLDKKIFAGAESSGSHRFVLNLLEEFNIDKGRIEFVDILDLFSSDVIFNFTDIIGFSELRDLREYKFYSMDDPDKLGKGSIVDGICLRYPQLKPFIIPKELYGEFTPEAVLTISVDAILICRSEVDTEFIYNVTKLLSENRQKLIHISPLLYEGLSNNFDHQSLNFPIHPGAKQYSERDEPTLVERYAELGGVVISIIIAIGSAAYTLTRIKDQKKKDHIDVYYDKLLRIRRKVDFIRKKKDAQDLLNRLKDIQEITIRLVIEEKLLANESFSIFLTLSQLIVTEIHEKCSKLEIEL